MNKDRNALMDDGYEAATEIIERSTECVAGLIGLPPAPEAKRVVLEDYQVVVIGHALLTFLDARYEERCPPDNPDPQDSTIENHKVDLNEWWQREWEKAHPNLTHAERVQGIKAIGWILENFKCDRSYMEKDND